MQKSNLINLMIIKKNKNVNKWILLNNIFIKKMIVIIIILKTNNNNNKHMKIRTTVNFLGIDKK